MLFSEQQGNMLEKVIIAFNNYETSFGTNIYKRKDQVLKNQGFVSSKQMSHTQGKIQSSF